MSVIPDFVIENWKQQYDEGSELWAKYPEFDYMSRQMIRDLASRDEQTVRVAALPKGGFISQAAPLYLATAGAPLAGKSTVLDFNLASRPGLRDEAVKIDPDRWGMMFMANLYHGYLMSAGMVANVPDGEGYSYAQQRAYDIARPASNYITLELMNEAVEKKCHIVHGTTMTSPHISGLLKSLRGEGYELELLLCAAPDHLRAEAAEYRANVQGYYQATPEDVKSKGVDFPKRLKDYFALADRLSLYWRDSQVTSRAAKVAVLQNGQMGVTDQHGFDYFANEYSSKRAFINASEEDEKKKLLDLPELTDMYEQQFHRRRSGLRFYGRDL